MASIILNRSFNPPQKFDPNLHPCFVIRDIVWVRSLVAEDDSRCICELEASCAELVRSACRQAAMPYDQLWRAAPRLEQHLDVQSARSALTSALTIVEIENGLPAQLKQEHELQASSSELLAHGVQLIHAWVSSDRRYWIGAFNAADVDVLQQAFQKTSISLTRIWRSHLVTPAASGLRDYSNR